MVLKSYFPPDIRVEKEAHSLLSAKHKVYLLAKKRKDSDESFEENFKGLKVRRILPVENKLTYIQRKINSLRFYCIFCNNYWLREIERYILDYKIEVLHIHELPLIGTGIKLGKKFGIPVIVDLHENYPVGLKLWHKNEWSLKNKFTENERRWKNYEAYAVKNVNHVIVVVDEAKDRLIEQYNITSDKVSVVMNTVEIDFFRDIKPDSTIVNKYKYNFLLTYVGSIGPHRGLNVAVKAVKYLQDKIPEVKLLIVGARSTRGDNVIELAEHYGVKDMIEVTGWQDFKKIPEYINASDICLVPHHRNPHTNNTIPHKLFQYMAMGKPVVVSNCKPLKRIVEKTGSGLVFQSGSFKHLAEVITILYKNKKVRTECGRNGYKAVVNYYNWSIEAEKLSSLYKSLEANLGV